MRCVCGKDLTAMSGKLADGRTLAERHLAEEHNLSVKKVNK